MPQSQVAGQRTTPSLTANRIEAWLETIAGEVFDCHTLNVSDGGACITGLAIPIHVSDKVRLSVKRSSAMDEGWIETVVRWRTTARIGELLPRRRESAGRRDS